MRVIAALQIILAVLSCIAAIPLEAEHDASSSQAIWRSPLGQIDPTPRNEGWLAKILGAGGEGNINVLLRDHNLTLTHRPSAFPASLSDAAALPLAGVLLPIASFPSPLPDHTLVTLGKTDETLGCYAPLLSRPPTLDPKDPLKIALVVRGSCPFSTKVRAAQERGASAVIVGDGPDRAGESDAEGRLRDTLITMYSPDDTDDIQIPSVFVSRASYLILRDLINEQKVNDEALWLEIGRGEDDGSTLGSILLFALLCPSMFLLFTVFIHKIRMARQRERDRAPPLVVLSLPERIWTPEIAWEKDDDVPATTTTTTPTTTTEGSDEAASTSAITITPAPARKQLYFSKDECAICMEAFVRGDSVRILPCGHVFHKVECDEWLLKWRKLCPTCRADVTIPNGASGNNEISTLVTLAPETGADTAVEAPRTWAWQRLLARFRRQRIVLHERIQDHAAAPEQLEETETERLV